MEIIRDNQSVFEPNNEFKNEWLGTRKKESIYGDIKLPGLFSTYRYDRDLLMFLISLLIEFTGILLIILMNFELIPVIVVLGVIIVDIILASKRHNNAGKLKKIENDIILETDSATKTRLVEKKKKLQPKVISAILIYLFTVVKIAFFFLALSSEIPIVVIFALGYLFSAFIHINYTGFWVNHYKLKRKLKQQYSVWAVKASDYTPLERGETTFSHTTNLGHSNTSLYKLLPAINLESSDLEYIEKNLVEKNDNEILNLLTTVTDKVIISYKEDITETKFFDKEIEQREELKEIKMTNNGNEISVYDYLFRKNKKFYKLYSKGILLDDDVAKIADGQQTDANKALVAKECLRHQIGMLN